MDLQDFTDLASGIQPFATTLALIAGGIWAFWKYGVGREGHPHIEFAADVNFVVRHGQWWIAELTASIANKGKVRHKITDFHFDLHALSNDDSVVLEEEFGNQVLFPNRIAKGSWLTGDYNYYFIEPGVTAKYSHIARIPVTAKTVLLHAWFSYPGDRSGHTAERTVKCPSLESSELD